MRKENRLKWSDEQLQTITEFAELFFTPKEIAIVLQKAGEEFLLDMQDETSEAAQAFQRGRLMVKASVRKKLFLLASQGSSQAQALVLKLEQESDYKILKDEYDH